MGRAVSICPDALIDDGLLDFTLVMGTLHERVQWGWGGLGLGGWGWVGVEGVRGSAGTVR